MMLVHKPFWFVLLSALVFVAWGQIYSLFAAAIADVFKPDSAATNYWLQCTAKGVAPVLAGWGASALVEWTGSWMPVLSAAALFDLAVAARAFFWLKPLAVSRQSPAGAAV